MTYAKPAVAVLGDAKRMIESIPAKSGSQNDSGVRNLDPAYDLDE